MIKNISTAKSNRNILRLAAIPVLVLVLGAVVLWPSDKDVSPPTQAVLPANTATSSIGSIGKMRTKIWPSTSLAEIAACDIFAPLDIQSRETKESNASNALPHRIDGGETQQMDLNMGTLQAIYQDQHGAAAIVDSRIVRVGDELGQFGKVVEITSEAVFVRRP